MLAVFIALLLMASMLGALAQPATTSHGHARAMSSSSSSAGGGMNLLTDLGDNSTLLLGDVGIHLPNAIPTRYTQSPPVQLGPISVSPSTTVTVGTPVLMSVQASQGLPPYTYTWSFGNGQTGSGNAVSVTYTLPGTYTVIATVQDSAFHTASSTVNITVLSNLQIVLSPTSQSGTTGSSISWSYLITGGELPYNVTENFGDGSTSTFMVTATNGLQAGVITHEYLLPGTYLLTLSVTDALGDVASAVAMVNITYAPLAISLVNVTRVVALSPGEFNLTITGGTGTNEVQVNWGDGISEIVGITADGSFDIYHTYQLPGDYIIQFNATDTAGAFAQGSLALTVFPAPLGSMLFLGNNTSDTSYVENLSVALGHEIVLNATIFGGVAPYSWALYDNNQLVTFGTQNSQILAPGFTVFSYTIDTPGINVYELLVQDNNGVVNYSNTVVVNVIPQTLEITNVPSPTSGPVPINIAFNVSLYNVEFNSAGVAEINISINIGIAGLPSSTTLTFYGTPNTFANEINILAPYNVVTYVEPGNYSTQFDANYYGNSTVVNSNIVVLHLTLPPELSVSFSVSPQIGPAPLNTSWNINATGGFPNYYTALIKLDSQFAFIEASSVSPSVSIFDISPGVYELSAPALFTSSGKPYFDFTFNAVYGLSGTYTASVTVDAVNTTFSLQQTYSFDVTIVAQKPSPLVVQLFASQTTVGVGMPVFFSATITGGGAPYFIGFYTGTQEFGLEIPTPIVDEPLNFQSEPLNMSGQLFYNYFNYTSPGIYTASLFVIAPSSLGTPIPIGGHVYLVYAVYQLTINVIGLSASIQQNPTSNLVAPVDIAFAAQTMGGEAPFTYQWALSVNGSMYVNISTQQSFAMQFDQGMYSMQLTVMDSLGNMAVAYDNFSVGTSSVIAQVISARVQAMLTPVSGGPSYYAYSGPAMWGSDGSINASFLMPNVPAVNAQYWLNVSFGYTVAITEFVPSVSWLVGEYPIFGGSWQTYYYNVYSPQPYASQVLTVVAGGQILSASQLQNGLNGVNSNLSKDTAMLSVQINGAYQNISVSLNALKQLIESANTSISNGMLMIQAQGSKIEASLSALNASIVSVGSSVNSLSGSLSSDYATISTSLGNLQASFSSLNATIKVLGSDVTSLQGAQVQITTDIGTLNGDITNISNGVATIQTTAGQIKVSTADIQTTSNNVRSSIGTVMLFDIIIIVLVLITLGVGLFSVSRSNALAKKLNGKGKGGSGGTPPAGGSTMMVAVQPYRPPKVLHRRLK